MKDALFTIFLAAALLVFLVFLRTATGAEPCAEWVPWTDIWCECMERLDYFKVR